MNKRLDRLLCKKFPLLFGSRFGDMRSTAMCWGFECGDGWYQIIKKAAEKLEPIIDGLAKKYPEDYKNGFLRASQVKEKYGTLRFYLSSGTSEMEAIVDRAERESAYVCETCGKPGRLRGKMWLYTACKKHAWGKE